jgi:RNA polymerase sigma factor (sigma-70 family)
MTEVTSVPLPVQTTVPPTGARTDPQLLRDFTCGADQAAFAQIVRRHGPAVLGVCRRVLQNTHDAEDAFQATFLVLARQVGSLRKTESLASWLHGVSFRIAMKARRDAVRRRKHETQARVDSSPQPGTDLAWGEIQTVLDEEVERLRPIYRSAFVLCCLEGRTQAEAARQLGIKEGTISSRLTHARKRLQEALARRGITLSALLAALALSGGTRAAVPRGLTRSAARMAEQVADGSVDGLSGSILTLAQGATPMISTRLKLAILLLLTAVSLGLGGRALNYRPANASDTPAALAGPASARNSDKKGSTKEKNAPALITVTGRVLDPDGKGVSGATLSLWRWSDELKARRRVRARTDGEGRFRLALTEDENQADTQIIATAKGFGADWARLNRERAGKELILRLVPDLPIVGRLLDLEGKPIAGVAVNVRRIGKRKTGNLGAWLESQKIKNSPSLNEIYLVRPDAFGGVAQRSTDEQGQFRIEGFGEDRLLQVVFRGPGIETTLIWVASRPGPERGWKPGPDGFYPARFTVILAPSKPIVGRVTDRKTGKPIPGISVVVPVRMQGRATTDAEGRYRITGVGKRKQYWVAAGGLPYFNSTKLDVSDTPGLEPLRVDFVLDRGIVVRGKLLNRVTGEPVRGRVSYVALLDNPHRKDFADLDKPQFLATDPGETRADGSFAVLAIPGAGVLCATAEDRDRFVREEAKGIDLGARIPEQDHTIVPIEIPANETKPRTQDITLKPGHALPGQTRGPDGKPLTGAYCAGLSPIPEFFHPPQQLEGAEFSVGGLSPGQSRPVLFLHAEKKLARLVHVKGDRKDPLNVRLEPLGTFTGRIFTRDGKPWVGVEVTAAIHTWEGKDRGSFPLELRYNFRQWSSLTNGKATTDKEGRFRIGGLVPGLPYRITVNDPEGNGATRIHEGTKAVEAGKARDLGDLQPTQDTSN